jgi:hypothetical protein
MPNATLGVPVPDNLAAMSLEDLHKLHVVFTAERAQLRAKQVSILPTLWAKQAIRDRETRASFDQVIGAISSRKFTLADAKKYYTDAQSGLVTFASDAIERFKKIIASGKDEE